MECLFLKNTQLGKGAKLQQNKDWVRRENVNMKTKGKRVGIIMLLCYFIHCVYVYVRCKCGANSVIEMWDRKMQQLCSRMQNVILLLVRERMVIYPQLPLCLQLQVRTRS